MNGQKTKYEKYLESLELIKESVVPRAKLNMRGAILFAKEKKVFHKPPIKKSQVHSFCSGPDYIFSSVKPQKYVVLYILHYHYP